MDRLDWTALTDTKAQGAERRALGALVRMLSHTLTLSPSHPLTLSHSHTLTLSHSHSLSHCYILTLSHSCTLTLALSHHHSLTLSHSTGGRAAGAGRASANALAGGAPARGARHPRARTRSNHVLALNIFRSRWTVYLYWMPLFGINHDQPRFRQTEIEAERRALGALARMLLRENRQRGERDTRAREQGVAHTSPLPR